jgi:hypothetical protein
MPAEWDDKGVTRGEFAEWWSGELADWMKLCRGEVKVLIEGWPK